MEKVNNEEAQMVGQAVTTFLDTLINTVVVKKFGDKDKQFLLDKAIDLGIMILSTSKWNGDFIDIK